MTSGHVFIVRGKIGEMVADAAIVSTDADFRVEPYWFDSGALPAETSASDHRPTAWGQQGWGLSRRSGTPVWFVNVTSDVNNVGDAFDRLGKALADIASSNPNSRVPGRALPLIVLPVIGTKGGGFNAERGRVVDRLLEVCRAFVRDKPLDLAIVATSAASHAALQHQRRAHALDYFDRVCLDLAKPVAEHAQQGSLALLIGAGTSIPAGAPSWSGLIEALVAQANLDPAVRQGLEKVSVLDQAELLQQKLGGNKLGETVAGLVSGKQPALAHLLLAALGCQGAVTTNYDDLYERAVASSGGTTASVLPSQIPRADGRWLLKMHGDAARPHSIVLTRGQFVDFASSSGPSGAVLQSLLLTKHLLVVGTSMTDDNLLRLIHEVAEYRTRNQVPGKGDPVTPAFGSVFGTILAVDADPVRRALHERHFTWASLSGDKLEDRTRELEIVLDAVAMYASGDHSWLLDERFDFLLNPSEHELADRARRLAQDIKAAGTDGAWQALGEELVRFGAPRST